MPVNSLHPDYRDNIGKWRRVRDCRSGGDAVKAARQHYLPALETSAPDADARYSAYLNRALFYGATGRTVAGLAGTVFRKPPSVVAPPDIIEQLGDVTTTHVPAAVFALQAFSEMLTTGRVGILVDMPDSGTEKARPYWVAYRAEQIINWRTADVGGRQVLTLVVLAESAAVVDQADPFKSATTRQYRVLSLTPDGYEVQVYQQASDNAEDIKPVGGPRQPLRLGERLQSIPFWVVGPTAVDTSVEQPPLLDLADVNLSHYRTSADLEHGRHYVALPTPYVAGVSAGTVLEIGSGTAWVFSDPQARAGMLEFTGQGLQALERAMVEKQSQMAVLGGRLLESQKSAVEAADTLMVRQNGEQSVLRTMAGTLSQALSMVLTTHAWWAGFEDPCAFTLNTEFFARRMDAPEAQALVTLWQAGGVSWDTLYYNLQRGEWTKPGREAEEEHELIDADQSERVGESAAEQATLAGLFQGE